VRPGVPNSQAPQAQFRKAPPAEVRVAVSRAGTPAVVTHPEVLVD
jgi:hypothetical protein